MSNLNGVPQFVLHCRHLQITLDIWHLLPNDVTEGKKQAKDKNQG
jgi:hypothetical protein